MKRFYFLGILVFFGYHIVYGMDNTLPLLKSIDETDEESYQLPFCLMKTICSLSIIVNSSHCVQGTLFMLTEQEIRYIQKILHSKAMTSSHKNILNVLLQFPNILVCELIKALPVYQDAASMIKKKCLPNDEQLNILYNLFKNLSPVLLSTIGHSKYLFSDVFKQYLPFTYFAVTGKKHKNCYNFKCIDNMLANEYFMRYGQFINNFFEKTALFGLTQIEIEQLQEIVLTDKVDFSIIKEKFITPLPNVLIENIIKALPVKIDPADGKEKKFLSNRTSKKLFTYYKALSQVLCAALCPTYTFSPVFKKYLPITYFMVKDEKNTGENFSNFICIDYMLANTYLIQSGLCINNSSKKSGPFELTSTEIKKLQWIVNTDELCFSSIKEEFIQQLPNVLIKKVVELLSAKIDSTNNTCEKLYTYYRALAPILCTALHQTYEFSPVFQKYLPQTYCAVTGKQYPSNVKTDFEDIDCMLKNEYLKKDMPAK